MRRHILLHGKAGDHHEREADRAAGLAIEGKRTNALTNAGSTQNMQMLSSETLDEVSALGDGSALPKPEQQYFGARFGHDFSKVRVHVGGRAEIVAKRFGANAFTVGDDLGFTKSTYQPLTRAGRWLIAHELAHVVQQRSRFNLSASLLQCNYGRYSMGEKVGPPAASSQGAAEAVAALLPTLPDRSPQQAFERITNLVDGITGNSQEREILAILFLLSPVAYRELMQMLSSQGDGRNSYLERLYEDIHGEEFQIFLQIDHSKTIAHRAGSPENIGATLDELNAGQGIRREFVYRPFRVSDPSFHRSYPGIARFEPNGELFVNWQTLKPPSLTAPRAPIIDESKGERIRLAPGDLIKVDSPQEGQSNLMTPLEVKALHDRFTLEGRMSEANVVGIVAGVGSLAAAGSASSRLAIGTFQVLLPAAGQFIAENERAIALMEGGPEFLRAWQVFNLAMAGYGIAQLLRGGGRTVVAQLRDAVDELEETNPGNSVARQVSGQVREAVDEIPISPAAGQTDDLTRQTASVATAEDFLDAIRQQRHRGSTGVGAQWDFERFPLGPRKRWKAGDPIDTPSSAGEYPSYETARRRYWKNRAFFERQARLNGSVRQDSDSADAIRAMGNEQLDRQIQSSGAPSHPVTGRTMELEHFGVPQRVQGRLQELGFSASESRQLSEVSNPGALLEVEPLEHAFFDAEAWGFGAQRADIEGTRWAGTQASDPRAGRAMFYMSDETLEHIVSEANARGLDFNRTAKLRELRDWIEIEIRQRGLNITVQ